jgi:hypothetical protein
LSFSPPPPKKPSIALRLRLLIVWLAGKLAVLGVMGWWGVFCMYRMSIFLTI